MEKQIENLKKEIKNLKAEIGELTHLAKGNNRINRFLLQHLKLYEVFNKWLYTPLKDEHIRYECLGCGMFGKGQKDGETQVASNFGTKMEVMFICNECLKYNEKHNPNRKK
jgi:hypothetical protein